MKLRLTYNNQAFVNTDVENLKGKVPEEVLLSEVKKAKIQEVKRKAGEYIESRYPLWKQSNDKDDKDRIIVELIYYFKNAVTADDIRYSVAQIVAGKSDVYTELVKHGIKAGLIQTDEDGKPLYIYELTDGTTQIANIDREYKDEEGNLQTIPEEQVKDRHLLFTEGTDPQLIGKVTALANELLEITQRILWKDRVREESNKIEEEINALSTVEEVLSYEIRFTV